MKNSALSFMRFRSKVGVVCPSPAGFLHWNHLYVLSVMAFLSAHEQDLY